MRWVAFAWVLLSVCPASLAQGTKLWIVDRYDQMAKGLPENVTLRSDGRVEAGPATSQVLDEGGAFVWSVASDAAGSIYAGLGGTTAGSAKVVKLSPGGKPQQIFEAKELGVQAIKLAPDGSLFLATSPDGKVYRISPGSASATPVFNASTTPEKPKYLWDIALDHAGELYVAAGAPAVVYRVPAAGGTPQVLFKTADQHIRCLALSPDGTLWAGSDGSGVVYRIATSGPAAKPFAVYAAPHREITSLALGGHGELFVSAVGGKGTSSLAPLPVTGNPGITITFLQPGSTAAAGSNSLVPEGSEIYRIAPDGTPERLLTLKDEVVYALAVRNGSLLAATGNRGRVYRVDTEVAGRFAEIAHFEASQVTAFAATKDGLLAGTSNSGKLFRLDDALAGNATFTSEVFDAGGFSQWGRAEVRGEGPFEVSVRTGNVENPQAGWSDWSPATSAGEVKAPSARFAQWRAALRPGGSVDSVALNYLRSNVAPVVDEIVVQPGARVAPTALQPAAVVQVQLPSAAVASPIFTQDASAAPLAAQKDRTAITVRWSAHDENGDDLLFSLWYRGAGEQNWRLLKDKISDRFYSFDSALLPDGSYEVKVIGTDAPNHAPDQALTGEKRSEPFVVDTTPPVPGTLQARMDSPTRIHATLTAHDATSPIAHAEYSVDAEPWQYLEPLGKLSDAQTETYDFTAAVPVSRAPISGAAIAAPREHVLAVRVYDRYDNMAAVKTVVHP